jgi:hypothetical protein
MALSKIQAESMNLADTFAFTGAVSGVGGLVSSASATASGTIINFTSLPDGIKHIKISGTKLSIASGSGSPNSYFVCRIGANATLETSGYGGSFFQQNSAGTDGVTVNLGGGSPGVSGNSWVLTRATATNGNYNFFADLRLINPSTHQWGYSFVSSRNGTNVIVGAGSKTLSARLDRVAVYTYSGYTLDNGEVVIHYA